MVVTVLGNTVNCYYTHEQVGGGNFHTLRKGALLSVLSEAGCESEGHLHFQLIIFLKANLTVCSLKPNNLGIKVNVFIILPLLQWTPLVEYLCTPLSHVTNLQTLSG